VVTAPHIQRSRHLTVLTGISSFFEFAHGGTAGVHFRRQLFKAIGFEVPVICFSEVMDLAFPICEPGAW
jgi:hypothetical protein